MNPAQVPQRPFALLVTHAALGSELLRTVEAILGAQSDVQVLSNDGLSSDGLSRAIEERVRDVPGDRPVVLFTDLGNPTSNSIYRQIGFVPVRDDRRIRFDLLASARPALAASPWRRRRRSRSMRSAVTWTREAAWSGSCSPSSARTLAGRSRRRSVATLGEGSER